MRAMVLESQGIPLSQRDIPIPEPASTEALIRVSTCGVCHTDLHELDGDLELPRIPVVPGHQIVGVVERLGSDCVELRIGDRVGIPWLHRACGTCRYCVRGQENLCENAEFSGLHVNGGYAEYTTVDERFACPIPDAFDDEHAAPLLCAGIIGYRSLRLAGLTSGSTLALFGFGASAHICLQVAVARGCRVAVFSRSAGHRKLAESLGAEWTGESGQTPPFAVASAVTFAPIGRIVHDALGVLDRGGTLAVNAVHLTPIPELPYPLLYQERTVRSVTNATRDDAVGFLREAADARLRIEVETFDLTDANEALDRLRSSSISGAAVLRVGGAQAQ